MTLNQSRRDEVIKYGAKTHIACIVFLTLFYFLFAGGCLERGSGYSGGNETEIKIVKNRISPTPSLKTEEVNISEPEWEISFLQKTLLF
jgi:hypothetical protein